MPPAGPLLLQDGDAICSLLPRTGGSIGSWIVAGQPMLRSADPDAVVAHGALASASFPLVPYSNRIVGSAFGWNGRTYRIPRTIAAEANAIHGVGFIREWQVIQAGDASALLRLDHSGDDHWPWPFVAQQRVTLDRHRLMLELSLHNLADEPVPSGFGHHPYFDSAGASLKFAARSVWIDGAAHPPAANFAFAHAPPVTGRAVDHCFTGEVSAATIAWAGRPLALRVTASPSLPAAVVYIPRGEDYFCFEPVPHRNHALTEAGGIAPMQVISPGGIFSANIALEAYRP